MCEVVIILSFYNKGLYDEVAILFIGKVGLTLK